MVLSDHMNDEHGTFSFHRFTNNFEKLWEYCQIFYKEINTKITWSLFIEDDQNN
jgi:hypothetical protein